MLRNYIYFIFLSLILTPACEEPFDIELEEETRLVVQSYFSDNADLIVYVSESRLINDDQKSYTTVKDAEVKVFADDVLVESLTFISMDGQGTGYYKTNELQPVVGKIYSITVDVPGFDAVTASNYIPEVVEIDSVIFDNSIENGQFETEVFFNVSVSISDPEEYDNYYHLIFSQELIPYIVASGTNDTIFQEALRINKSIHIESNSDHLNIDQFQDIPEFIISDESFNGQGVSFSFSGNYSFDPKLYLPGNFRIELRTVSREYYQNLSHINDSNGSDNPFVITPVVFGNIHGGFGVFAGYNSSEYSQTLSD